MSIPIPRFGAPTPDPAPTPVTLTPIVNPQIGSSWALIQNAPDLNGDGASWADVQSHLTPDQG
jgi:hypothetical protein